MDCDSGEKEYYTFFFFFFFLIGFFPFLFSIPHPHPNPNLIPLPSSSIRTRTPAQTSLIPAPLPQPFLCRELQLALQLRTRFLAMNEIAEPAADAALAGVEPAAGFAEVGDGREFAVDGAGGVPSAVQRVAGCLRRVFVFETGVDVAD